ncbi:hypothetical protein MMC12_001250 [Toensbergia leucococca]|nr:hypothetical protein [Toensbergia leucococca]
MAKLEVRVSEDRALQPGDSLTFFYPSTEWEMAQSFQCTSDAQDGVCKRQLVGAAELKPEQLEGY